MNKYVTAFLRGVGKALEICPPMRPRYGINEGSRRDYQNLKSDWNRAVRTYRNNLENSV